MQDIRILGKANLFYRNGEYEEAIALYREWQSEYPDLSHLVRPNIDAAARNLKLKRINAPKLDNSYCDLNYVDNGILHGWACNRDDLNERLLVEILINDRLVGTVLSDKYRRDLEEHGIGDGKYAIYLDISEHLSVLGNYEIRARMSGGRDFDSGSSRLEFKVEKKTDGSDFCTRLSTKKWGLDQWDREREEKLLLGLDLASVLSNDVLVSVVMPTLNRSESIGLAIESVLNQLHSKFELLIIDDGSTDNTSDIVSQFNDPRVVYIKHASSQGVSAARNTGINSAKGDWIFFLDSDNWWEPGLLRYMLTFLLQHRADAAYCASNLFDDSHQKIGILFEEFELESCLKDNYVDLNSFCVSRDLAELRFDTSLRRLVDWDFVLRIASVGVIKSTPYVGVNYYTGQKGDRITNTEYQRRDDLNEIRSRIRGRALKLLLTRGKDSCRKDFFRIAFVFHIYHETNVEYFIEKLQAIRRPFSLIITTSHSVQSSAVQQVISAFPWAMLIRYPNIGSDIGPFLELFSTLINYDLVCKFHTKRDMPDTGSVWREYAVESLIGSEALVNDIVELFQTDNAVSLAGPMDFYLSGVGHSRGSTLQLIKQYGWILRSPVDPEGDWGFFAGTMFWFRPQSIADVYPIQALQRFDLNYREDGKDEHAIERVIGMLASKNGSKIVLVDNWRRSEPKIRVVTGSDGQQKGSISAVLSKLSKRTL